MYSFQQMVHITKAPKLQTDPKKNYRKNSNIFGYVRKRVLFVVFQ
jgi:hypothetical protein